MDFRVLGPLEVLDRDLPIELGAAKQKALLGLLLIARGEAVSADRLIEGLWGGQPPPTAVKSVQVYVSHLRKVLGEGRLMTTAAGYVLTVAPQELDAERFEQRLAEGRRLLADGDAGAAAEALRAGLGMWRGPALADFVYQDFAQDEIARLEELRLSAIEERVDADLALGRHGELIAELERLVRQHPLREQLRERLMLALYRSGRQAEALESFQAGRHEMRDGLGIEPGRDLRALQEAILRQDPDLDAPRRHPGRLRAPTTARSRALIAAGVFVSALAIAAALMVHGGRSDRLVPLLAADTVGAIDPATGRLESAVGVPGAPDRLAAEGGRLWAVSDDARTLTSLDTGSVKVGSVVAPGGAPSDVAAAAGRVWTVDTRRGRLQEIDPAYGQPVHHSVQLGRVAATGLPAAAELSPWRLAATANAVWVTNGSSRLIRVDVATRRVNAIDAGRPLNGVTVAHGAVWAISSPRASVVRVDPASQRVTGTVPIVGQSHVGSPAPLAIDASDGVIWVVNGNTADVSEIDADQLRVVDTIPIGVEHQPDSLAVGQGAVWVADTDGTLARINPTSGAVRFTAVAHELKDVAVAAGRVWVSASVGAYGPPLQADTHAASARSHPGVEALAPNRCSPLYYRPGDNPRLLIVSDLSLQTTDFGIQGNHAIELALRDRGFRAGRYPIAYQACDNSTSNKFDVDDARCTSNAHAYASNASVVGVIAATDSGCVADELPILNRAPHGPLAALSPISTYVGLTRRGPGTAPGEPASFAPSGTPGFVRLTAADDIQAAADAVLARRLGVRRAYTIDDGGVYGAGVTAAFRAAADKLGIRVVGRATYGRADDRIAARVRDARADGVFLGGVLPQGATMLIALRRALPPTVHLLASDGFNSPYTAILARRAADGLLISTPGAPNQALPAAGRRFAARLRTINGGVDAGHGTVGAAQSALILLDAIARSDGTRPSVLRALFATKVHNGLLGTFAITPQGDTTARPVSIYRIDGGVMRYQEIIDPPVGLTGG